MNAPHPYTAQRAKRSIVNFLGGKAASAVFTFGALVLLARLLEPADYGLYVAVFAFVEIFYLYTGFGLSIFAQKYITELRVKGYIGALHRALWWSCALRQLLSVICAGAVFLVFDKLAGAFDLQLGAQLLALFVVLLVFETAMRFFTELFPALLLQGHTQFIYFARSALRMPAYGWLVWQHQEASLQAVLTIDLAATAAACLYALVTLAVYTIRERVLDSGPEKLGGRRAMLSVCLQFYISQVLGQIYGNNMLRILVGKFAGLVQAAYYGFALALSDMLRNYLPGYLLLGVIRPMFVARYTASQNPQVLDDMFNFVVKMNYFTLLPLLIFFVYAGEPFLDLISHGKYGGAYPIMLVMILVVSLQCVHTAFAMINMSTGSPNITLIATLAAISGLPVALIGGRWYGAQGVVCGALVSEVVWCMVCWYGLRRGGARIAIDFRGFGKLVSTTLVISAGVLFIPHSNAAAAYTLGLVGILVYMVVLHWLRPFSDNERDWVNRVAPGRLGRLFVW
ncbi:oligosaccharide flippase family protein [Chitiniphilus purpureus]|uniref:Oligosaccharide flippase family protein n=1 Tax=Chitiniphilus purpureus TaxID=2981137 RepID=A0ABY6DJU9_9NEIS|nr:oligosaccharide flippase family protein [Chitiniphilus sp. CD1]UXY14630.1 oligosaccharide flippase family protein [Chitiniphilus sp. CD1]